MPTISDGFYVIDREIKSQSSYGLTLVARNGNLMRFSKAKCMFLHMIWSNPQYEQRPWDGEIENSPNKKLLGLLVDKNLGVRWKYDFLVQKPNRSWAE